jgi:hypothetical protein
MIWDCDPLAITPARNERDSGHFVKDNAIWQADFFRIAVNAFAESQALRGMSSLILSF